MKYRRIERPDNNACFHCIFGVGDYDTGCYRHASKAANKGDSCMEDGIWKYIFVHIKELSSNIKVV